MRLTPEALAEELQKSKRRAETSAKFKAMVEASCSAFSGGISVKPEPEKNIKRCWKTAVLEVLYRGDGR